MSEQEFVEQIKAHKHTIHKVCNTYCENYSRADLFQEIVLETWKSIGKFKNNCSFNTWVYNIARNTCIDFLRRHKARPSIVGLEEYADTLADVNNAPEIVKQLRQAIRYNSVLASINEPYRTLFEMYLDGVTYEEMVAQTGMNANLLRQKIDRIKKRLQLRYGSKAIKIR